MDWDGVRQQIRYSIPVTSLLILWRRQFGELHTPVIDPELDKPLTCTCGKAGSPKLIQAHIDAHYLGI